MREDIKMKEKIIAVLLFVVPSVDFLPFWNPTVTGRFILFDGLITIAALFLMFYYLFSTEKVRITLPDICLFLIFAYVTTSRFFLAGDRGFSIRYYELCGLYGLYVIVRAAGSERHFCNLVWAAIFGGSIQLIVGYLQLLGILRSDNSFFRVTGGFFNSGPYAGYLASVYAMSLTFWKAKTFLKFNRFWSRVGESVLLFNLTGLLLMIPLLKSRACLLAVAAGTIFLYRKDIRSFLRQRIPGLAFRVVIFSLAACTLFGGFYLLVKMKASSSHGRWLVAKNAVKMIGDHPLTGVGYDRFRTLYMGYQASYFAEHPGDPAGLLADNVYYAFCEPLQFVVENGVLGLLPVLAGMCLLGGFVWGKMKSSGANEWLALSLTGLLSILVFSMFSYTADILPIKMNGFLLLAMLVSQYNGRHDRTILFGDLRRKIFFKPAIALLLLPLAAGIFQTSVFLEKMARGFFDRQEASVLYSDGQIRESIHAYGALYPLFSYDGDFLVHYGKALYFAGSYDSAIAILGRAKRYIDNTVLETGLGDCYTETKKYAPAENAYTQASHMVPGSFYNKYLLFKLYQVSGQKEKSRNLAGEIQHLTVKIPSPAIDSIKSEMSRFLSESDFQRHEIQ